MLIIGQDTPLHNCFQKKKDIFFGNNQLKNNLEWEHL